MFLYKQVLGIDLGELSGIHRIRKPKRLPVVLSSAEVGRVLGQLSGTHWLMAMMLYGGGLRRDECIKLRIKGVDFGYRCINVIGGKGAKAAGPSYPSGWCPSLNPTFSDFAPYTETSWPKAQAIPSSLMRFIASTRMRGANLAGNSCFLRQPCASIRSTRSPAVGIVRVPPFKKLSAERPSRSAY